MRFGFVSIMLVCLTGLAACSGDDRNETASEAVNAPDVAATPAGAQEGEWRLHGLSPGEQRYSPLDQINAGNLDQLGLAFEYDDFIVRGRTHRGVEATALMDDGVLYFTGPWSVVYAIDARSGEEKWVYDPEAPGERVRVMCCDAVNRGAALDESQVYVGTIDGYLVALNKDDGSVNWKVDTLIDREASYSITGAPRLAGDLIVIGNGGAEMGVRGYVTAYDKATGDEVWRFFTVPSAGPDETPDITRARETWNSDEMPWEYGGGGTVWDSMVYDEALGLFYIGVGNGTPWTAWERGGGDNLYLSSIVALDVATGAAQWHYQTTPGDSWDYTATQHMILADIEIDGALRKVIMQAPKNGFFYVLDRETGELLSAEPFVDVSWASHVDMETGRPVLTENADFSNQDRVITPSAGGAHNWPPMAYNPDTGLVYFSAYELANRFMANPEQRDYINLSRNTRATILIADPARDAELLDDIPPLKYDSHIVAWDPAKGEARWRSAPQGLASGGVLTTAGGFVVVGNTNGKLSFFSTEDGSLLHEIMLGTAIMAAPMTYMLDGEQYLIAPVGHGGVGQFAYGPNGVMLKHRNYERLLAFKLGGGETPLPEPATPFTLNEVNVELPSDPAIIALGKEKYERFCVQCHVPRNVPGGIPSLWNMPQSVYDAFDAIVLDGAYSYAGMAGFADVLGPEDTIAIRAYIEDDKRAMKEDAGAVDLRAH